MTLLHPPICKQQRHLQRNNTFNEATSSRFQEVSIQRSPHDVFTPPHPPSVNNNDTCNVTTSSTKQHPQGFNRSQSNAVHMTLLHPPHPPSVNNNDTCNVTTSSTKQHPQGFNKSQSNAVHVTLLHPPFCKQQRYLQRNNIFNEATSSRFQQVSIQRSPHDVITPSPPPHPHLFTITTFIVHDKTEGSWKLRGTPSLDPTYLYAIK